MHSISMIIHATNNNVHYSSVGMIAVRMQYIYDPEVRGL